MSSLLLTCTSCWIISHMAGSSSSNFIFPHNTWTRYIQYNRILTDNAYPGYCIHVLCWRSPEKALAYLAGHLRCHDALMWCHCSTFLTTYLVLPGVLQQIAIFTEEAEGDTSGGGVTRRLGTAIKIDYIQPRPGNRQGSNLKCWLNN